MVVDKGAKTGARFLFCKSIADTQRDVPVSDRDLHPCNGDWAHLNHRILDHYHQYSPTDTTVVRESCDLKIPKVAKYELNNS